MTTNSDLIRLEMVIESVSKALGDVARLKDHLRPRWIRTALNDVRRAQWFWIDGRATGMIGVQGALASTRSSLAQAASTGSATLRATLVTEAHRKVLTALHEVKQTRAMCSEEVANVG